MVLGVWGSGLGFGILGLGFGFRGILSPIIRNQMGKNMEHESEDAMIY